MRILLLLQLICLFIVQVWVANIIMKLCVVGLDLRISYDLSLVEAIATAIFDLAKEC